MYTITDIVAREILDSRGNPTVEVDVYLSSRRHGPRRGALRRLHGRARSRRTARRRRKRYLGKGVLKAVDNVNSIIAPELIGYDVREQFASTRRMIDARRHPQQGEARAPTPSSACAWPAPRPRRTACELPLYRYIGGAARHGAARAHDEHPERRRSTPTTTWTSRSSWSCPWAHRTSPRRCGWAPRSSTP